MSSDPREIPLRAAHHVFVLADGISISCSIKFSKHLYNKMRSHAPTGIPIYGQKLDTLFDDLSFTLLKRSHALKVTHLLQVFTQIEVPKS